MSIKQSKIIKTWWKFTKLLIFMTCKCKKSNFSKIWNFGPPTKNSDFSDFFHYFGTFHRKISRSGISLSILKVNHLLVLFLKLCNDILTNSVAFIVSEIYNFQFCQENMEKYVILTSWRHQWSNLNFFADL